MEDLTEDWWVSDDEQDYPMTDAAYLDEEGEDGELKIAVIDSVRTEAEMEATRAMIEDNRKQNLAVDEWLDAVKDAVDQGEPSGKEEKLNIPDAAVKGKGKEVVVISDDDQ